MKKWIGIGALALCAALLAALPLAKTGAGALSSKTALAEKKSGESFSIQQTAAGAYTGQLSDKLSTVSGIDIMCSPNGIAAMPDGSLLVSDTYNKLIRIVKNGKSSVYAGGETVTDLYGQPLGGYNDAGMQTSYFSEPWAITPFLGGWAVSDAENGAVRLIRTETVETVNGKNIKKKSTKDSPLTFKRPTGLAADGQGNLYVADTLAGTISVIAPDGSASTLASGLSAPMGLCWQENALYVAEAGANRIIRIADGKTSLVAGSGTAALTDGSAKQAAFSSPQGITAGENGVLYVSDTGNSAIRKISGGEVTTLIASDKSQMSFGLTSPAGLLAQGNKLYICDPFSRKLFVLSLG